MFWEACIPVKPSIAKGFDEDEFIGFFEGFAATSDIDFEGDRFTEEVIVKNSATLLGKPVLLMHGRDRTVGDAAVGRIVEARYESGKGLWIKAGIFKVFENVWRMVKNGILNALSIGGYVKRMRFGEGFREIEDAEITEVSLTNRGVNPNARIITVFGKSLHNPYGPKALAAGFEAVEKNGGHPLDTPYLRNMWARLDSQRLKRAGSVMAYD
ncbi:MAG: HK97 family phage prohead protease [Candidatus Caldarchaeum sp.]